jgi:hypothetical protein
VKSLENWIKNYLNMEGKLISFPSKRKLKIAAMFYIASDIDEDVKYSEMEINDVINKKCCSKCGEKQNENSKFCSNCGSAL